MELAFDKQEFKRWIKETKNDWLNIFIVGQVFGGRPGEAPQKPKDFKIIGDTLLITFKGTERLWIKNPIGIKIENNKLIIEKAEMIRWGWHYYGREQTELNRAELLYIIQDKSVNKAEIVPLDSNLKSKIENVKFDFNQPILRISDY